MLERTKTHRINKAARKKVIVKESPMSFDKAMKTLMKGEPQGAVALRGFRTREGLTQAVLGDLLGIAQTNISKMERGVRPIGKLIAKKLAEFFKTDYRIFL